LLLALIKALNGCEKSFNTRHGCAYLQSQEKRGLPNDLLTCAESQTLYNGREKNYRTCRWQMTALVSTLLQSSESVKTP